jgi:phospholipid/cholesterol/gamma-HCH transport system substrate-binding protein
MAKKAADNIKLGVFVITGMVLMIFALYMIGGDTNLFGKNYTLKVRFDNAHGLTSGNNIRYAGIQIGTVKNVKIISDTVIEVSMLIKNKMKQYIHRNDIVSMSTDGLMGNKIVNITPSKDGSPLAEDGDFLAAKKSLSTDDMLATLDKTNRNIAEVSEDIKTTVDRINSSTALWKLLNESAIPENLSASVANIRKTTDKADNLVMDLHTVISDIKSGKGSLGKIITDTAIAFNLNQAVEKIKKVGDDASQLAEELNRLTTGIEKDINSGKGPANALLRDSALVIKLNNSLSNIEKGTAAFNQNMEALKHNFFFRGYFRKLEKAQQKQKPY